MAEREDNCYRAKLAEQAERYDEMVDYMVQVAKLETELQVEERNLLSVAYKNVVGARRSSWRIVSSVEQKDASKGKDTTMHLAYKKKIEAELSETIEEVTELIDKYLFPSATSPEAKVFFYKMKGDYLRYKAEYTTLSERKQAAEASLTAYKAANDRAMAELTPTHPIRLGLALNFSVFFYEILSAPDRACRLAKAAFDDAIAELDQLNEDSYKDSTLIMQLLRDNLTLWTTEMHGDGEEQGEDQVKVEDVEGEDKGDDN